MAADPNDAPGRIIAFQPCWGCQQELQEEEEEQKRLRPLYAPRNFLNHQKPDVPCARHCPDCARLPRLDSLRQNFCQRHYREHLALVTEEDQTPTIKELGRLLPYRDARAIGEAARNFFPPTGQLGPKVVEQARQEHEAAQEAAETGKVLPPAEVMAPPTPAPFPALPRNVEVDEAGWLTAVEDKEPPETLPEWLRAATNPAPPVNPPRANAAELKKVPLQELPARETPSQPYVAISKPNSGDVVVVGRPRTTGPMKRVQIEAQKELHAFCLDMEACQPAYVELSAEWQQRKEELERLILFAHEDHRAQLKRIADLFGQLEQVFDRLSLVPVPDIPDPEAA
jgi:hypothetical protein